MNKEIIEKVLSNPYLGKGGGYHIKDIKKALKLKEEEVLKKINELKDKIKDYPILPLQQMAMFKIIDNVFEEELKKEIKNE